MDTRSGLLQVSMRGLASSPGQVAQPAPGSAGLAVVLGFHDAIHAALQFAIVQVALHLQQWTTLRPAAFGSKAPEEVQLSIGSRFEMQQQLSMHCHHERMSWLITW